MTQLELLFTIAAGVVVGGVILGLLWFILAATIEREPTGGLVAILFVLGICAAAYWFFFLKL